MADVSFVNRVEGFGVGSTQIYLQGRNADYAAAVVIVSDEVVVVADLISRVVTGIEWEIAPPSTLGLGFWFTARTALKQDLSVEGSFGHIFSRVIW